MESVWFNNYKRWLNDAKQYNNCQRAIFIGDANRLSFSKTVVCSAVSSSSNLRGVFVYTPLTAAWMDQRRNHQQNAPTAQLFTFYLVIHRNCSDSPSIKMTWRNSNREELCASAWQMRSAARRNHYYLASMGWDRVNPYFHLCTPPEEPAQIIYYSIILMHKHLHA